MTYHDTLITTYDTLPIQTAFRTYFAELGAHITNWDGLFAEMTESGDPTWLRTDDQGNTIGFLMFAEMDMKSWFFEAKCGFLREFWVAPEFRHQGHGRALLHLAEQTLTEADCAYLLLTTDTAPGFYLKAGYVRQPGIRAKNQDDVYVKQVK